MTDGPTAGEILEWERRLAPVLFNHTWELLDTPERTPAQDAAMLSATFAQRHLWYQVGTPRNRAIADWQVARVAAVLGLAEIADRFGRVSLAICDEHELDPFYRGYAHEAIARAADVMGDTQTRNQHVLAARELARLVVDAEERQMLSSDVEMMVEADDGSARPNQPLA
jgi:hypothetical protein